MGVFTRICYDFTTVSLIIAQASAVSQSNSKVSKAKRELAMSLYTGGVRHFFQALSS